MNEKINLLILLAAFLTFGCIKNNRNEIIAKGTEYAKEGKYDKAISEFNKVIAINSNDFEAYNWRSGAYFEKGNTEQALSDLSKAIAINPTYRTAYLNRAIMYFKQKEYNKALEDVHKCEELGQAVNPEFVKQLKEDSGRFR